MAVGRSCRGGDLERAMTSWWRLEASAFSSGEVRRGVGTTGAASADGGASAEARGHSMFSSERRVLAGDLDGRKVRGMPGAVRVLVRRRRALNLRKNAWVAELSTPSPSLRESEAQGTATIRCVTYVSLWAAQYYSAKALEGRTVVAGSTCPTRSSTLTKVRRSH